MYGLVLGIGFKIRIDYRTVPKFNSLFIKMGCLYLKRPHIVLSVTFLWIWNFVHHHPMGNLVQVKYTCTHFWQTFQRLDSAFG